VANKNDSVKTATADTRRLVVRATQLAKELEALTEQIQAMVNERRQGLWHPTPN